jgi:hypothetical protein
MLEDERNEACLKIEKELTRLQGKNFRLPRKDKNTDRLHVLQLEAVAMLLEALPHKTNKRQTKEIE